MTQSLPPPQPSLGSVWNCYTPRNFNKYQQIMGIGIHAFPVSLNDGLASYLVVSESRQISGTRATRSRERIHWKKRWSYQIPTWTFALNVGKWLGFLIQLHQLILLTNLPEKSPCTFISMMGFSISTGFLKQPTAFSAWCGYPPKNNHIITYPLAVGGVDKI